MRIFRPYFDWLRYIDPHYFVYFQPDYSSGTADRKDISAFNRKYCRYLPFTCVNINDTLLVNTSIDDKFKRGDRLLSINNCEVSSKGKCLKCESDYILIGKYDDAFQICKSRNSEEFKNCKYIDSDSGLYGECEDEYFLTPGNSKCIKTQNCYDSAFGICTQCIEGFYLNKKNNEYVKIEDSFFYCKQTLNEKNCDNCNFGYYMAEDEQCSPTLFVQR